MLAMVVWLVCAVPAQLLSVPTVHIVTERSGVSQLLDAGWMCGCQGTRASQVAAMHMQPQQGRIRKLSADNRNMHDEKKMQVHSHARGPSLQLAW